MPLDYKALQLISPAWCIEDVLRLPISSLLFTSDTSDWPRFWGCRCHESIGLSLHCQCRGLRRYPEIYLFYDLAVLALLKSSPNIYTGYYQ